MSLQIMDGFDRYASIADFNAAGYATAQGPDYLGTGGRFGGVAIRTRRTNELVTKSIPSPDDGIYLGISTFITDAPSDDKGDIIRFKSGGTIIANVHANPVSGVIEVYRGNSVTLLASTTGALSIDTWHRLEIYLLLHDSTGRFVVEVDQTRVIDFTGDTLASATTIDAIEFTANVFDTHWRWDDLTVMDDAGDRLDGFIGDVRIYTRVPDSDVTANWTPSSAGSNFADVDETPNDADTTYVEAAAAGVRDEYGVTDLPVDVETVHAVKAGAWARKTDANNRELIVGVGSGVSEDVSVSQALTSSFGPADHIVEDDPDTLAQWTPAGVNAAELIQETA